MDGAVVNAFLVPGAIVSSLHPRWNGWFYAEVQNVPPRGATGPGSKSATLRWLDEVGGEGSGVYEYDAFHDAPELIGFKNIRDVNATLHERMSDGTKQWLTDDALAAAADGPAYDEPDPDDDLQVLLAQREARLAEQEATRITVLEEMSAKMDTGIRVDTELVSAVLGTDASEGGASGCSRADAIECDPDTVALRTTTDKRQLVSSEAILSSNTTEWLNDCHVGSDNAMMPRPTSHTIKYNYPRGEGVEAVFSSRPVQKTLSGERACAALVQNYVSRAHWRKLIICFHEQVVYYFEPFGSPLRANSAIIQAFEATLRALDKGWRFECIQVKFQTDGHSCGVWDIKADYAFVDYVDSASFGSGTFGAYLVEWMRSRGVVDLNTVRGIGGRREAIASNERFIAEERTLLRERLLAAARAGRLPFQDGALVDVFVEDGKSAATAIELEALDDK
jgi:hypothetical protein